MDLDHLLHQPPGRQEMVLRSVHPRRRSALLDEALVRLGAGRPRDARQVEQCAEIAARLAEAHGRRAGAMRARLELGNAQRRLERFAAAARTLREVEPLVRSAGSAQERCDLMRYRAAIRIDEGEPRKALRWLQEAAAVCPPATAHRVWAQLAIAQGDSGLWQAGRRSGWTAMTLAEEADDPVLALCATHNLAVNFCDGGEPEVALALLEGMRKVYGSVGTAGDTLRADWVRWRAMAAAGSPALALDRLWELALATLSDAGFSSRVALQIGLDAVAVGRRHRSRAEADAVLSDVLHAVAAATRPVEIERLVASARRCRRDELPVVLERLWRAANGPVREDLPGRWATRGAA